MWCTNNNTIKFREIQATKSTAGIEEIEAIHQTVGALNKSVVLTGNLEWGARILIIFYLQWKSVTNPVLMLRCDRFFRRAIIWNYFYFLLNAKTGMPSLIKFVSKRLSRFISQFDDRVFLSSNFIWIIFELKLVFQRTVDSKFIVLMVIYFYNYLWHTTNERILVFLCKTVIFLHFEM